MDKKLSKRLKKAGIILVCVIAAALLMHVTVNYLVPFIIDMHKHTAAY